MSMRLRPDNSAGQFWGGVGLGLGLIGGGASFVVFFGTVLVATKLASGNAIGLLITSLMSGPLMILGAVFGARHQSLSWWLGTLSLVLPALLLGVTLMLGGFIFPLS